MFCFLYKAAFLEMGVIGDANLRIPVCNLYISSGSFVVFEATEISNGGLGNAINGNL